MEGFLGETVEDKLDFLHEIRLPAHFLAAPPTANAAFDGEGAHGKHPTILSLISMELLHPSSSSTTILLLISSPSLYKLDETR